MIKIKNKVIGYVYDKNGFYEKKYFFENTPQNISNFILQNFQHKCTITDTADNLILTSMVGGFVDYCPDKDYLVNELLPILVPIQMGEVEFEKIEFVENDYAFDQVMM